MRPGLGWRSADSKDLKAQGGKGGGGARGGGEGVFRGGRGKGASKNWVGFCLYLRSVREMQGMRNSSKFCF